MLTHHEHVDRWLRVLFHYWPAAGAAVAKEVTRLRMIEERARALPECRRARRSGVYCDPRMGGRRCARCKLQVSLDMPPPDFSDVDERGLRRSEEGDLDA